MPQFQRKRLVTLIIQGTLQSFYMGPYSVVVGEVYQEGYYDFDNIARTTQ